MPSARTDNLVERSDDFPFSWGELLDCFEGGGGGGKGEDLNYSR